MDCIISTAAGSVKGYMENGICRFHGIPYAAPPVGERRFCMPQPHKGWEGIRDASFRHAVAPQGTSDMGASEGKKSLPKNEDCLTLAVSTPSLTGKLPVAVWLHGGANCYGGGGSAGV